MEKLVSEISEQIRGGKCVIALSGGIDSSIAAILASEALGKNLLAMLVDHGFMRDSEEEEVESTFRAQGVNVVIAREEGRFMARLRGVTDPEAKRCIVGEEFIRVFEGIAEESGADYLIQGAIYPDRIESGDMKHSDKIDSPQCGWASEQNVIQGDCRTTGGPVQGRGQDLGGSADDAGGDYSSSTLPKSRLG